MSRTHEVKVPLWEVVVLRYPKHLADFSKPAQTLRVRPLSKTGSVPDLIPNFVV